MRTGLGQDSLGPQVLRSLTAAGLCAITEILNEVSRELVMPKQCYLSVIVLLGKPDGGLRPIALLAMLYRLWLKCHQWLVAECDVMAAGPWDHSVKGKGAMSAAGG